MHNRGLSSPAPVPVSSSDTGVAGTIAGLYVYPIKSCAGIALRESVLLDTGLEFDRAWMLVDEAGEYLTQRQLPRMALVRPQLRYSDMVLRAPGMLALHVALDAVEEPVRVRVWSDEVAAYDMGDIAAQWFTDFLCAAPEAKRHGIGRVRLVRFDPEHRRLSNMKWTQGVEAPNQFADGFPVLVASEASLGEFNRRMAAAGHPPVTMERFRPNVVLGGIEAHDEDRIGPLRIAAGDGPVELVPVKPCARCPIPDVDPATGIPGPEVGDVLRSYRRDPRMDGAITFGMNLIATPGVEATLRVGQAFEADYAFA